MMNRWKTLLLALSLALTTQAQPAIQILCDGSTAAAGRTADEGFACLVRFAGKVLLFDAGLRGTTLLANMKHLGVDPGSVDTVFISHNHGDHLGGLTAFLSVNARARVLMPAEATSNSVGAGLRIFEAAREAAKARGIPLAPGFQGIGPGIHTTGLLAGTIPDGRVIEEQGLVLDTAEGLVIVLGCSHPSPIAFVRLATERLRKPVALLVGGFHLQGPGMDTARVEGIVTDLKRAGVHGAVPTHCTGEAGVQFFRKHFTHDCLEGGVGRVLPLAPTTRPQVFMPEMFSRYRYVHGRIVFSPEGGECLWDL